MTSEQPVAHVASVTVTFHPDTDGLLQQLSLLAGQVERRILVDNGSRLPAAFVAAVRALGRDVEIIELEENKGVAAAQNVGIERAREGHADFVLLLDHDSLPAPDMVAALRGAYEQLTAQGHRVAALGPRYVDPRHDNPSPFVRTVGLRRRRCLPGAGRATTPVDHLISSGCLLPMAVLDRVGGMNEGLFIDYVDIEWCLRAKHLGYEPFGVFAAHMTHSLGDKHIGMLGKKITLHTPARYYYQFRNPLWIYRQPWTTLNWVVIDACRLAVRFVIYALFAAPRRDNIRMMVLGLWHGIRGRLGPLSRAPEADFSRRS